MKEQVYKFITILATVVYFVPVLIIVFKKLWKDVYFLYLGIYWLAGALINVILNLPGIGFPALEVMTVLYNMIDIPFILWILWYTSFSSSLAKLLRPVIVIYIIVELILVFTLGINYDSLKYIMGAGILVVLITLVWEINLYLHRIEHTNRERSMLFIYASLLFWYGSYTVVYIFDYFVPPTDKMDKLLIYYVSSLIAVTIACFGFLLKKNRKSVVYK